MPGDAPQESQSARVETARWESLVSTVQGMEETVGVMATDVALLKQRSDHALENCPMRVEIALATRESQNAKVRANHAMVQGVENRVDIAKVAAISGLSGGGAGAVVAAAIIKWLTGP